MVTVDEYQRHYNRPWNKKLKVSVSYTIGKSVTDGFRWGKIMDQVGDMVKVQWDVGKQDEGWRDIRTLRVVDA